MPNAPVGSPVELLVDPEDLAQMLIQHSLLGAQRTVQHRRVTQEAVITGHRHLTLLGARPARPPDDAPALAGALDRSRPRRRVRPL